MGNAISGSAVTDALITRGHTQRRRDLDRAQAIRSIQQGEPMVYAMRLTDGIIKIGCSRDVASRRKCVGADAEILAFRFGDEVDEQAIHETLIPHRARAWEYYHPTPEVLAVVNDMREEFGLPHIAA